MNEKPLGQRPIVHIVAYLAAVAVGCLVVGALAFWGHWFTAGMALWMGFLPGLLLCLPGTLLSFQVSKHFRLSQAVWHAVFGALTGVSVGAPFVIAFNGDITASVFPVLIFATAGAAAGLTYRWVEKRYSDYLTKYF